jgi:hypothetical protein
MEDYIVVYYYNRKEKTWIADVVDEENIIVESVKAYNEKHAKEQARNLVKKYNAIRFSKTDVK